jgi:hypothetical protein
MKNNLNGHWKEQREQDNQVIIYINLENTTYNYK